MHRLLRLVLWLLSHNRATTATNVFSDAASSTDTIIVEIVHVPIYKLFFFSFYYTTPCVWLFDSTNIPCLFFHSSVTITETKWKCMCSFLSVCGETLFLFDPSCFLLSISSHSCYLLSTDFLFLCFILSTFPAAFLLLSIHNTP